MKKLILIVALIASFGIVKAQDAFEIGLKGGFNSTKIKLDYGSDVNKDMVLDEAKNGSLFGAYARIKLIGNLSFQPELYYSTKKTKLEIDGENYGGSMKTWDIPLLANVQLLDLKVARIYGVAGPVASFISKDDLNELKNTNWTFQAGAGVGFWRLTADVRYEWGLKDVSDLADFDIGQKTNIVTFSLGFRLFGI